MVKFWITLFVLLLIVLDILWMMDGILKVHYSEQLLESTDEHSMPFMLELFSDKPLMGLYYRIIISLLILVSAIMITLLVRRLTKYRNELNLSNQKYRSLFMKMKTGFALRRIIRDEKGDISQILFIEENPAFRQHTGLTETQLHGKSVKEIFGINNTDLIAQYDKIASQGGSFTTIHYGERSGKTLRITAYQHDKDEFATIVEDITTEKKFEDEIKESAQLKEILLDTISDGVFYLDTELKVLWANKKAIETSLQPGENLVGKACNSLWCGSHEICESCPAKRTLQSHHSEMEEYKNVQGRYLQVYSSPIFTSDDEIKGIVVTITDLTEWMNTIENLKIKQTQLNMTLQAGEMTTWKWLAENDQVVLEQSALAGISDKTSWKLQELHRFIHREDRPEFQKQRDELLNGKRQELHLEMRILSEKRKWVWYNLQGKIMETDNNGKPLQMLGVTYKIDNLKQTALALKQTNEELRSLKNELEKEVDKRLTELRDKDLLMIRQSRQAAMGEMIGNIAHQWRQPLNSVAVIIQDLVDAWDFGELTREYIVDKVNMGMDIINHMSNTIDDFRDFFAPDKLPGEFDLAEQVIKTMKILKDMYASQGIEIITELENITIVSYAREFSQVLINILSNAKDALVKNETSNSLIKVKLQQEENFISVSISDNAGGIAPEILDRIFEPYFTTKQELGGTGLGLYMSKNIIEKHLKGRIKVENSKTGAIFTICLPREIDKINAIEC